MERFCLGEACRWTGGSLTNGSLQEIQSVSTDTRSIVPGSLFIPLVGERFDGHDYIDKAIENGAAAVLSARELPQCSIPVIRVADTKQALLDLAAGYRATLTARVAAVTGSVGKTTTKEMLASVLSQCFTTCKTQGNLNNEIGLPQSIFTMDATTQAAVLEMGMNHFGEIARMTRSAKPEIAVITNIGTSHIEFLGSREGILQAKLEILEGLQPDGVAILCGDEPLLWEKRGSLPCRTIYYGYHNPECDIIAQDIVNEGEIVRFSIKNCTLWDCRQIPVGESIRVHLHVAGRHNVLNALAAAAAGLHMGEEPGDIAMGLSEYRPEGLRQNTYMQNGFTIFADCYNASPDAVEAALQAFSELPCQGKRIAVLGGMLELGDYIEQGHRRAGAAAAKYADVLYLYGAGTQYAQQAAYDAGMQRVFRFESHEELAQSLQHTAQIGDALLFKGSRAMHMEHVLELFTGEK